MCGWVGMEKRIAGKGYVKILHKQA